MSRPIRCRRCGVLFVPERHQMVTRVTRLCLRCRGPLPPTGSVPVVDGSIWLRPCPPQERPS